MADAVDTVVESGSGSDAQDLDSWAENDVPLETAPAAPAKAEPEKAKPTGKGADQLAETGGKGKQPVRQPDGKFAAEKPADPKPAPYDPKAKIKIVVDGEEEEITIEEALRRARKNSAADRRFQEASKVYKEAEQLRQLEPYRGMYSPEDIAAAKNEIKRKGGNPNDPQQVRAMIAETDILRQIEAEKMSPEARRALELERENNRLKSEQQAKEDQAKQAEEQQRRLAIREDYNKKFTAALQKYELPPTAYTVSRMAELMQTNLRMGLDLSADEIAVLVKEDLGKEQAAYTKGLSVAQIARMAFPRLGEMGIEEVVKVLPKDFLDKLRKYDLDLAKRGGQATRPVPPKALGVVTERPRRERVTRQADADKALEDWAGR